MRRKTIEVRTIIGTNLGNLDYGSFIDHLKQPATLVFNSRQVIERFTG